MTKPLGYTGGELLQTEFPKPNEIVGPVVQEGSLTLLWGMQKSGKTFIAGKLAYSIATGTRFLKWMARQEKVTVVDSEMRDFIVQKRLKLVHYGTDCDGIDNLRVITREHMGKKSWNLVVKDDFKKLVDNLGDTKVLILDNYNNLTGETYQLKTDLQQWKQWEKNLAWLRDRGIAVVLIHHGNKGGEQSGTQQRVNFMETVIQVRQDRHVVDALGMEFIFTDSRSFFGADTESLLVEMKTEGDRTLWSHRTLSEHKLETLKELNRMKTPKNRLAEMLGVSFLDLQKLQQKIKDQEITHYTEEDLNDPF